MNDDDVVRHLQENPGFFVRHPDLFTEIQLPDPHNGSAVSLVERQASLLRERVRALELRLAELLHIGRENDALARHLVAWSKALLAEPQRDRMPAVAADALRQVFGVPLAEVRIWGTAPGAHDAPAARWITSLPAPVCGTDLDLGALQGLADSWSGARSAAVIPLRTGDAPPFGMIALGSPDPARFDASLGTAVLARIGELAGAALAPAGPAAAP